MEESGTSDNSNVTYIFSGHDHTLGNSLRYMLMKDPNVEFAGYTVPHPSEPYMNVRVQTHDGNTADAAVEGALKNISWVCDHVLTTFQEAKEKFKSGAK
ncbi:unnamed protein product [Effrenium voratum]|uniref:DNA-directed RNA polymerase RBP11-like dimerisation domain-containing protein n=1 Tax=Effrenium voratum TaxID=2562239 RepID=A0AA36HPG3_9DINO|nr:unnamed protein product [Effrenium voratum]